MSEFLLRLQTLVERGDVVVSRHGLLELANRGIFLDDVIAGVAAAIPVEEYPDYKKGHLFWSRSGIIKIVPFTWSGASQRTL
jgi:hypothetical protein